MSHSAGSHGLIPIHQHIFYAFDLPEKIIEAGVQATLPLVEKNPRPPPEKLQDASLVLTFKGLI